MTALLVGFWIWASLTLILRIWLVHRREPEGKKLFWSVVVLVPLFGWLFYGGLFRVPPDNETFCEDVASGTGPAMFD